MKASITISSPDHICCPQFPGSIQKIIQRVLPCLLAIAFAREAHAQHSPTVRSSLTTNSGGVYSLVIPNDPETAWKQLMFTDPIQRANPLISGPNADPDRDGRVNLLERQMGGHPLVPNSHYYPTVGIYSYVAPSDFLYGRMSLTISREHLATDLDPVFQVSTDLKRWKSGEEFTFVNTIAPYAGENRESWEVTSILRTTETQALYMRLAPVRPSRLNIKESLAQIEAIPADLLDKCVIPSGEFAGALTSIPRVYNLPSYNLQTYNISWYFASVGLVPFVESKPVVVKNYLECHLRVLKQLNLNPPGPNPPESNNYRMRDFNIDLPDFTRTARTDIPQVVPADADDSSAATFLGLASRYALKWPNDPWFAANVATLKAIWTANIKNQRNVKKSGPTNGLVRTYQEGWGLYYVNNQGATVRNEGDQSYLEDNVEVWADTLLFADALKQINDPDEALCRAEAAALRVAINDVLWDSVRNAWKPSDQHSTAVRVRYYADLQCQYFPELFGFTHYSGYEETQRRYDAAWAWLNGKTATYSADWWTSQAWDTHPDPVLAGQLIEPVYSDMGLAVVAMRRGDYEHARAYIAFAIDRWMTDNTRVPDNANKSGTWPGTVVSDIGYWHYLLKGVIARP